MKLTKMCLPLIFVFTGGWGEDLEALLSALSGNFSNAAQATALPDSVSRAPALEGAWMNSLYLSQRRVRAPALDGEALYLLWREDGPGGAISRRRLWRFREDEEGLIWMDFHAFRSEERMSPEDEPDWEALSANDLTSYPEGCALRWRKEGDTWRGSLDPQTCSIVAQRSGRRMALFAEIVVTAQGFTYRESGRLEGGAYAFRVPGWDRYAFDRME
jgi:hypothetical protein